MAGVGLVAVSLSALVFNSQSTRNSVLGAKWTHSYNVFLTGTSPVVLVEGDGTETAYSGEWNHVHAACRVL